MFFRPTLAMLCCLAAGAPASAQLFVNIATGYNPATGGFLPNGAPDTRYQIVTGGTGGHIGETPLVRTAPIPNGWLSDAASGGSHWVVLPGSGMEGITVGQGTYFFETTVVVSGVDASQVMIQNLKYAADNKLLGVTVNGAVVFQQPGGFAEEFQSFHTIGNVGAGLFLPGANAIRFEVLNDTTAPSPLGLRVEGAVVAAPEPPLGPLSLALSGLWFVARCVRSVRRRGGAKS